MVARGEASNAAADATATNVAPAATAGATDTNAAASAPAAVPVPAPVVLKSAGEVFDFSTGKLAGYKSWTGDVVQKMSMFGKDVVSSGTIIQKQPRRMRLMMDEAVPGQPMKMSMVLGSDGIMWQEMDQAGGGARVIKMDMVKVLKDVAAQTGIKLDPLKAMDPSQQWAMTKELMDYTLKGVQNLHGQPVYVLEGTWRDSALTNREIAAMAAYLGKSVVYVGQDDGFVHKFEQYAAVGTNKVMSTELTNLKFNPDVPDDVFKYQPPADAQVQDVTPSAGAPSGDTVPQPATPAPAVTPSP